MLSLFKEFNFSKSKFIYYKKFIVPLKSITKLFYYQKK